MEFCDDEKLLKKLSDSAVLLDQVQKGLNDYLETKRGVFARFYFLSNDDLLSILSESKDVMRVQLGVLWRLHAVDACHLQERISWLVSFSSLGPFGPRRGRRGASEGPRSHRWRRRDRAAAMASARRHATATPSPRPHESRRTASRAYDAPRRSASCARAGSCVLVP